jgi:hypothetical protein
MPRQIDRDSTEFFTVAGAPLIERRSQERPVHALRAEAVRPRWLEIGLASAAAAFCVIAGVAALFANTGAGKLAASVSKVAFF